MNKTFPKCYIIPPLELKLNYIVMNYCLQNTTCFTYAEDNFIKVTSLCERRLTVPNITAQLNQCCEKKKCVNIHCEEKTVKLAYMAELPWLRKQNNGKRLQWVKAHKDWTIEQWNKVLWIDESKFEIFGSNRRVYLQ